MLRSGLLVRPALAVTLIGLAACATGGSPGPSLSYACTDGTRIGVGYPDDGTARVRLPSRGNVVLFEPAGGGEGRYTDGQHVLQRRQSDVVWTNGSIAPTVCREG